MMKKMMCGSSIQFNKYVMIKHIKQIRAYSSQNNNMELAKKFLLVDGLPIMYRNYYGTISAYNKANNFYWNNPLNANEFAEALAGMFMFKIKDFINGVDPDYLMIVFDGPGARRGRNYTINDAKQDANTKFEDIFFEKSKTNLEIAKLSKQLEKELVALQQDFHLIAHIQTRQTKQESLEPVHDLLTPEKTRLICRYVPTLNHMLEMLERLHVEPLPELESKYSEIMSTLNNLWVAIGIARSDIIAVDSELQRLLRVIDYPAYKAHRSATPEALKLSAPLVREYLSAAKIPFIMIPETEADDIIGTLVTSAQTEIPGNSHSYIVSPDKDFVQLINENTTLLLPKPGSSRRLKSRNTLPGIRVNATIQNLEWFEKTYEGLASYQYVDILALAGDSADNIPGIYGVGPKRSVELIRKYGTVENLLAVCRSQEDTGIRKVIRDALLLQENELFVSKELVTINRGLDLDVDFQNLKTPML